MDWAWYKFTIWHLSLTHPLFIFLFLIPDIIKSEDRQKLAKERREEKAKYLGKWKQGVRGPITQEESSPLCWGERGGCFTLCQLCRYWVGSGLQLAFTRNTGRIKGYLGSCTQMTEISNSQGTILPKMRKHSSSTCILKWAVFCTTLAYCTVIWMFSALAHLCTKMYANTIWIT